MTLIVLLTVFCLEYFWRFNTPYRSFSWFEYLHNQLFSQLEEHEFFSKWIGVLIILLVPVLLLWLFLSLFDGLIYTFVSLLVSCFILFISLRQSHLLTALESYFGATKKNDYSTALTELQSEFSDKTIKSETLVRNASEIILTESQKGYLSVIFWFILLGPYGALVYRLAYEYRHFCQSNQSTQQEQKPADITDETSNDSAIIDDENQPLQEQDDSTRESLFASHTMIMQTFVHWLDWLPVRVTGVLFLLAGDFSRGASKFSDYVLDFDESNDKVVTQIAFASLALDDESSSKPEDTSPTDASSADSNDAQEIPKENQMVGSLIKRTAIIYLVIVALLTPVLS
jgi:membrane protein required for beta-lactamase induction